MVPVTQAALAVDVRVDAHDVDVHVYIDVHVDVHIDVHVDVNEACIYNLTLSPPKQTSIGIKINVEYMQCYSDMEQELLRRHNC